MRKPIFVGSGVAIVTPFTNEGINFEKLGEIIEYHIKNKTDAIIICGTTGEASTMTTDEHKSAIKYAVEKTAKRIPVIAGTGSNNTMHALEMSKYADEVGADGLLIVTPYYNKTTPKGLMEHYSLIAKNVNIPIIIYNIQGRTGLNISAETMKELSKIENIAGVKESSGSISQVAEIAALCGDDFAIYSGDDNQVVPILALGGKGVISVIANIAPQDTHDMVMKFLDGDTEGSRSIQLRMLNLIKALFIEVNPIPVKTAMNMLGFDVGKLRLPLVDMSEKNKEVLRQALIEYGLLSIDN